MIATVLPRFRMNTPVFRDLAPNTEPNSLEIPVKLTAIYSRHR